MLRTFSEFRNIRIVLTLKASYWAEVSGPSYKGKLSIEVDATF